MGQSAAVELTLIEGADGTACLQVLSEDGHGDRFTVEIQGPERQVRDEAAFLAEQYHLMSA